MYSVTWLYRKPSLCAPGQFLKLSVYVDDTLLSGPSQAEVSENVGLILERFPGRVIEPEFRGGFAVYDLLGANWFYSQARGVSKLVMSDYITKLAARFNVTKTARNPNLDEYDLDPQVNEVSDNIREIAGGLQWVVTVARPDIARAVNALSTYSAQNCTQARLDAGKRIIAFLLGTRETGIVYTPGQEKKCQEKYEVDGLNQRFTPPPYNLYTDASFASAKDGYYSVSGAALTFWGTPIAWRSSKQTILAQSTCQAEYIGAAEGLAMTEKYGFLEFYSHSSTMDGGLPAHMTLWVDSTSAMTAMKSAEPTAKTRHYVLKFLAVRQFAASRPDALRFCTTECQRADALTKYCGPEQRRLLMGPLSSANLGGLA